jgi:acylphosphatase
MGKVQGVAYRAFTQKNAQTMGLEGTVQNEDGGNITIYVCGSSDNLDKFIDALLPRTPSAQVNEIITEPLANEKNFRGCFQSHWGLIKHNY